MPQFNVTVQFASVVERTYVITADSVDDAAYSMSGHDWRELRPVESRTLQSNFEIIDVAAIVS